MTEYTFGPANWTRKEFDEHLEKFATAVNHYHAGDEEGSKAAHRHLKEDLGEEAYNFLKEAYDEHRTFPYEIEEARLIGYSDREGN